MLNLAIECSGQHGSLAVCEEDCAKTVRQLPTDLGSVQTLAPLIASIIEPGQQVGLISVTAGPGSFTGLRVGLATAKMLAFAWGIPLVGVDTLDVIAEQVRVKLAAMHMASSPAQAGEKIVIPVINAFRQQVFSSAWLVSGPNPRRLAMSQVIDASAWIDDALVALHCNSTDLKGSRLIFSGPGLVNFRPPASPDHELAQESEWQPRSEQVGRLGWKAFVAGYAVSARDLHPNYIRTSAAEESLK